MKNSLLLIAVFVGLTSFSAHAQAFEKGTKLGSAGIQIYSAVKPVYISFESAVADKIGIGGRISFFTTDAYTVFTPGVLGNYHFGLDNEKIDLYAGAGVNFEYGVGKSIGSFKFKDSSSTYFNLQGGGRYFLSEKWALNAQFDLDFRTGGTQNALGLGVTTKF